MPNVNFELNLNQHPKDTPNRSLVNALNVQLSNDLSCLQSEFSITERSDLQRILTDKYIAGYIPCNKEFILFIAPKDYKTQLDEHPEGIPIEIYRYKEQGNNQVNSFDAAVGKVVYEDFVWHGGKLKGTFTYNIKSHLIIAVAESDTITGNLIPLKTMDLGTYDSTSDEEDNDLHLEDSQLSLNPEVIIPSIKDYNYINGLAYKGWYYFFIRYKINSIDYTKWYPIGFPILIDDIEKYNIFDYNINQETEQYDPSISQYALKGYTSIVNQLSSAAPTCNSTVQLSLDNFSINFDKYQLAFINTTKDTQRAFKSLDIDIDVKEIVIDYSSLEESSVTDITFEQYNYYDVKNVVNYKNRLYLANYNEGNFNKDILSPIADRFTLLLRQHEYNFDDDFVDPEEGGGDAILSDGTAAAINIYYETYSVSKKLRTFTISKDDLVNTVGGRIYSYGSYDAPLVDNNFDGRKNLQDEGNWYASIQIYYKTGVKFYNIRASVVDTRVIDGVNHDLLRFNCEFENFSFRVDIICKSRISNGVAYTTFPNGNNGVNGDNLYYYTEVADYWYRGKSTVKRFSSRNIINTFKDRLKNRTLVAGGYYRFYIHFVNKYGECSEGIPLTRRNIRNSFIGWSNFDGRVIDDDNLFIVPDSIFNKDEDVNSLLYYLLRAEIDLHSIEIPSDIKGFFFSYEKYFDINNFYGILTAYDFKKDDSLDTVPTNFVNYSNRTIKYIYRFYCDEIDGADILQLKASKLVVYNTIFNPISNKYNDDYNKLSVNGIFEDKHTSDLLGVNDNDIEKYDIKSIKYVPSHSFIKNNDYRGGYIELTLNEQIVLSDKCVLAKLISDDSFLYSSKNKTLIKFTDIFYFDKLEPIQEGSSIYTISEEELSKGLNGFVTFGKSLIYNNDKVILNDGYNILVNSKYYAYTGSTNINEDQTGKLNNTNKYPFVGQYSYPIIKEYMLETRRFKTASEIIITRNEKLNSTVAQNTFAFSTSTIVKPMNFGDLYELPVGSQDTNNPKTYINYVDDFINQFDKRVIRSNVIADESFENSWRTISPESYKDITENKGNITNIVAIGTTLLAHTEHGLFMFDRDNTLKNGEDNDIQLAMPDIFDVDYKEIIASQYGACGLQDRDAWILDEFGYIFYDNDAHRFYKFGSKQIEIIDASIEQFINKYKPYQVRFINDSESNRILVNLRYNIEGDNNSWVSKEVTLSYNTKINKWISFHSYVFDRGFNTKQMTYFIVDYTYNDDIYSKIFVISRNNIEHQNINTIENYEYGIFENHRENDDSDYPPKISIIVNDSYELIKTLEYLTWKLYEIKNNSGTDTDFNFNAREYIKIPYSGDLLRIYNDNIDTGLLSINVTSETAKNKSVMNYKKPWWQYNNWNFNYLRDIKNAKELKAKFMSRLYGNYFIIEFTFTLGTRIEFETLDCKLITNRTI